MVQLVLDDDGPAGFIDPPVAQDDLVVSLFHPRDARQR
jgi:hypothetical protein